jgi:hypothetical protein
MEGIQIERNRNIGVCCTLDLDADYVLQIDSDMVFPPHALRKLLGDAMGGQHDIVGTTVPRRIPPFALVGNWEPERRFELGRLHEMEDLGTGFILVACRVFETLPGPVWFRSEMDSTRAPPRNGSGPSSPWMLGKGGAENYDAQFIGEDYAFCRRARAAGIKVMLDVDVSAEFGHIGQQVLYASGARCQPAVGYANTAWENAQ